MQSIVISGLSDAEVAAFVANLPATIPPEAIVSVRPGVDLTAELDDLRQGLLAVAKGTIGAALSDPCPLTTTECMQAVAAASAALTALRAT